MDDLDAFMDPVLHLPIGGVEYRVSCNAHQGLRVTRLISSGLRLNDEQERAEIIAILGDTYQLMLDNQVSWPKIVHAGRTAMFHFGFSPTVGQRIWESVDVSGNPIPPSPNQKAMGDKLRSIFRRPERTDRMILAAARTTP